MQYPRDLNGGDTIVDVQFAINLPHTHGLRNAHDMRNEIVEELVWDLRGEW